MYLFRRSFLSSTVSSKLNINLISRCIDRELMHFLISHSNKTLCYRPILLRILKPTVVNAHQCNNNDARHQNICFNYRKLLLATGPEIENQNTKILSWLIHFSPTELNTGRKTRPSVILNSSLLTSNITLG